MAKRDLKIHYTLFFSLNFQDKLNKINQITVSLGLLQNLSQYLLFTTTTSRTLTRENLQVEVPYFDINFCFQGSNRLGQMRPLPVGGHLP